MNNRAFVVAEIQTFRINYWSLRHSSTVLSSWYHLWWCVIFLCVLDAVGNQYISITEASVSHGVSVKVLLGSILLDSKHE